MRDLLLLTAFCAVGSAVAASMPDLHYLQWRDTLITGAAVAVAALFTAWLVFGRLSAWMRLPLGAVAASIAFAAAFCYSGWVTFYGVWNGPWEETFGFWASWWLTWRRFSEWFNQTGASICLGLGLLPVLVAARLSGWFGDRGVTRFRHAARGLLLAVVVMMAGVNGAVLWGLANPTPLPSAVAVSDNGWNDVLAAGAMVSKEELFYARDMDRLSDAELATRDEEWAAAYARIEQGLGKAVVKPPGFYFYATSSTEESGRVVRNATNARALLAVRVFLAERTENQAAVLAAIRPLMRLGLVEFQHASAQYGSDRQLLMQTIQRLAALRPKLNPSQKRDAVTELITIEEGTPPFDVLERRWRIGEERRGWRSHLSLLLDNWSGIDRLRVERFRYARDRARVRITMLEYALDLFRGDNDAWPESLAQLTPDYLPQKLGDPFSADGQQDFRYRVADRGYVLYSIGPDGQDDGGQPAPNRWAESGDLPVEFFREFE